MNYLIFYEIVLRCDIEDILYLEELEELKPYFRAFYRDYAWKFFKIRNGDRHFYMMLNKLPKYKRTVKDLLYYSIEKRDESLTLLLTQNSVYSEASIKKAAFLGQGIVVLSMLNSTKDNDYKLRLKCLEDLADKADPLVISILISTIDKSRSSLKETLRRAVIKGNVSGVRTILTEGKHLLRSTDVYSTIPLSKSRKFTEITNLLEDFT